MNRRRERSSVDLTERLITAVAKYQLAVQLVGLDAPQTRKCRFEMFDMLGHLQMTRMDEAEARKADRKSHERQCLECGRIFIQTDWRQKFCPPASSTGESACASRHRTRRLRARQKGTETP